jgi:hypothetical protein
MVRKADWKSWLVLSLVVALFVTSGGLVMASNMGFKINKGIFGSFVANQAPKRDNWVSLPYSHPYTAGAKALCNGLGFTTLNQSIRRLNPLTGTFADGSACVGGTTATDGVICTGNPGICAGGSVCTPETGFSFGCNLAGPNCAAGQTCNPLSGRFGYLVRNNVATPASAVLVGASDETLALPPIYGNFKANGAPKKDNWISVPYHTTWVTAKDVCTTFGLTAALSGAVIRINADPAASPNLVSYTCSSAALGFNIVMGEALLVRKNALGTVSGVFPPHF